MIVLTFLVMTIKKTFTNELNREMVELLISQSIFVFTFLIRTGLIFAVKADEWVDFNRDYPDHMEGHATATAMFPLQFIVYNILPYATLMLLHYFNYKPKNELEAKQIHSESYSSTRNADHLN